MHKPARAARSVRQHERYGRADLNTCNRQRVYPSVRDRVTTTQRMHQRTDDTQTDVAKAVAAVQEALRM